MKINRQRWKKGASAPFFYGAPGRAHSFGGVSPLRTLMTGTVSRTARAAAVRRGPEEAVGERKGEIPSHHSTE
jgi:hypothetical protein